MWQGALSQVGTGLCPKYRGYRDGGCGQWCVHAAPSVCMLLRVCAVVLSLLLMAGDIERNPGPTDKEGTHFDCMPIIVRHLTAK